MIFYFLFKNVIYFMRYVGCVLTSLYFSHNFNRCQCVCQQAAPVQYPAASFFLVQEEEEEELMVCYFF